LEWLDGRARELLPETVEGSNIKDQAEYLNALMRGESTEAVILRVNPLQLDARMVAQQGMFLCKLYHRLTFSQMLMAMMIQRKKSILDHPAIKKAALSKGLRIPPNNEPAIPDHPVVRKLVLNKELRITFLRILRSMNIHRASLFPGLDGFGQSLRLDLEMKVRTPE
jgi:hypothetical protein